MKKIKRLLFRIAEANSLIERLNQLLYSHSLFSFAIWITLLCFVDSIFLIFFWYNKRILSVFGIGSSTIFFLLIPLFALDVLDTNICFSEAILFLRKWSILFGLFSGSKEIAIPWQEQLLCFFRKIMLIVGRRSVGTSIASYPRKVQELFNRLNRGTQSKLENNVNILKRLSSRLTFKL